MSSGRYNPPFSALLWAAESVGAAGQSPGFDTHNSPWVSIFGNSSAATTLTVLYSNDGLNWYAGPTLTLAAAGNFHLDFTSAAEWIAVQSSAAATLTLIASAKG